MCDSLLRNYHDIGFVLEMEMPDFIGLFLFLRNRELEQKVWEIWLARYPHMTEDNFVTYEEMLRMTIKTDPQDQEIHGAYVDQVLL